MFKQNSFSGRKAQMLVAGGIAVIFGLSNLSFGQSIKGVKRVEKYRSVQINDKDVILATHEAGDNPVAESIQFHGKVLANRELEGPKGLAMWNRQLEGPKGLAMWNRQLEGPKGLAMWNRQLEGPKGLAMWNRQLEGPKGLAMN